ncbi:MAG: S41 family peptidase [Fibrobacteria bacterium]|nr:S41 family peptidase [Fibrobacteria bacterium]
MKSKKHFFTAALLLTFGCAIIGKQVLAGGDNFSYDDIIRLEKVINKISEFYVEEIHSKELVEASIEGLRTILDPHTAYFSEKEYNNLKVSTEGAFGGLGITIAIRDNILTIISPLQGTPAFRMGLQAGDKIIEIEGESTKGITVDKAVEKLRGKPKTAVTITVYREGVDEPLEFTIIRDIIRIKSVPFASMLNDSTGYVKVTQFSKRTSKDLREKVETLKKKGATSLILDLRNNPGGLLNQAIDVSNIFLDKKLLVVYTKGRTRSQNKEYFSKDEPVWDSSHRVFVLVNEGSASASEIVAGAIQDHDRGIIMGKPTFGKGSVQTILPLDAQKYALKLTTAYYYTPSGRCINKIENAAKATREEEAHRDSTKKDSSYFFTDSGRKVFAAGGITPDVDIEGNLYNSYIRELERKTMFFKFIIKNRPKLEKQSDINYTYEVPESLRKTFKEYIYSDTNFTKFKSASHVMLDKFSETLEKEREALGDTLKDKLNSEIDLLKKNLDEILAQKTKTQFEQNIDYINYGLKRELLQAVKGDSLSHLIAISRDKQIEEALVYINKPELYIKALTDKNSKRKKEEKPK